MAEANKEVDYSKHYSWLDPRRDTNPDSFLALANPDTLTKYKAAAEVSAKVLDHVIKQCVAGAKIVEICAAGDKFLEEEIAKVYIDFEDSIRHQDYSGTSEYFRYVEIIEVLLNNSAISG